jgi:hypothetical protein
MPERRQANLFCARRESVAGGDVDHRAKSFAGVR